MKDEEFLKSLPDSENDFLRNIPDSPKKGQAVLNPPPGPHENLYPDSTTAQVFRSLPGVGGFVGSLVPGKLGVPAAAYGGAMGETVNQIYQGLTDSPLLPNTMGGQLKKIGMHGAMQGATAAVGAGATAAAGALGLGKAASRVGEMTTGVPDFTIREAATNPVKMAKAYLPESLGTFVPSFLKKTKALASKVPLGGSPSVATAGREYGEAIAGAGIQQPIRAAGGESSIVDQALDTIASRVEADGFGEGTINISRGIRKGISVDNQKQLNQAVQYLSPQEAFETYTANKAIMAKMPRHGRGPDFSRHKKLDIALKARLNEFSPEITKAINRSREAYFARDVKRILPVNKYGDYSVGRLGFLGATGLPAALGGGAPGLAAMVAAQSPAVITGAAAAGAPLRKAGQAVAGQIAADSYSDSIPTRSKRLVRKYKK